MLVRVFAAIALTSFHSGGAAAQTREEMQRCRAIADDARRLSCYDEIRIAPGPPRAKYETLPLEELKEVALSYRGRLVEVTGHARPDGDFYLLGTDPEDSEPLPLDVRPLSRRDREALAEKCSQVCEVVVQGRVSPVNFVTGLVADSVVVRRVGDLNGG